MDLDATVRRRAGVTLVELRVANEAAEPRRVRVESELDGPLWYPRRHGDAAPGWDDEGYTGRVPADGRLALGFASPADPVEPPATVACAGRADEAGETTPADVVADLGDPRPPRDAVAPSTADSPAPPVSDTAAGGATERPRGADGAPPREGDVAVPRVPDAVAGWLDELERDGPGPDDRAALDAVAERVAALRR